jgi:heat-inducible transcriptional repressor
VERHGAGAVLKRQLGADEGGVVAGRADRLPELADQHRGDRPVQLDPRQLGVVLEVRCAVPGCVRLGDPQLEPLDDAAVVPGGLLAVADPVPGGHQVQLSGRDDLLGAQAVAVQHLAVDQPGHRLQPGVRVGADGQAGPLGHVGRPHVVGEAPRADGAAATPGQCPPDAYPTDLLLPAVGQLEGRRSGHARDVEGRRAGAGDRSAHAVVLRARWSARVRRRRAGGAGTHRTSEGRTVERCAGGAYTWHSLEPSARRRRAVLDDRKLEVLRAIVKDFVSTSEPVGSKSLAERHGLGVSPATVRNDMAALEDEGYITHPHTSAGRIPTDKGYRLFVDQLSSVKPLSAAEKRAIQTFLEGAVDLDDVVRRSVRLLAQLTRQVAVVQYPSLSRSAVRHLEIVHLAPNRLLLVLITDTGRVEQRVVEVPGPLGDDDVATLRQSFGSRLHGARLVDVPGRAVRPARRGAPAIRPVLTSVMSVVLETLVDKPEERIALAGTANLTRHVLDFPQTLRPVLEALEEQVVLLKLLGEVNDPTTVHVKIGEENNVEGLRSTSVVTVGYGPDHGVYGSLGVVGPTRMDYAGNICQVRAVARYVGELLAGA